MIGLAIGCLAAALYLGLGCATGPQPIPAADAAAPPDGADRFWGRVFNCHGQDLDLRARALGSARGCLSGPAPTACLLDLAYDDRSVACAVRDVGASANADRLAAGPLDVDDERVANAARAWLVRERLELR